MSEQQIHWFPGHMKKAKNEITERIKLVDVVIEMLDARAPISTSNKELEKLIENKPRLIILNKVDLADDSISLKWKTYFENKTFAVILSNVNDKNIIHNIEVLMEQLAAKKRAKEIKKNMKPQAIRAMVIGIPNVGKSTLINRIAKSSIAGVENRPGFTKNVRWIKVNKNFELLDTPGVLPMKYDDKQTTINLALLGSIKETILPTEQLSMKLIDFLLSHYPSFISSRYSLDTSMTDPYKILSQIALKRGYLSKGELNIDLASKTLLREFKDGIIGKCSLEEPLDNA